MPATTWNIGVIGEVGEVFETAARIGARPDLTFKSAIGSESRVSLQVVAIPASPMSGVQVLLVVLPSRCGWWLVKTS